jgi:hypothetical protein
VTKDAPGGFTGDLRDAIAYNKKHGLMCACNAVRVPYYGADGKAGTGYLRQNGTVHGFDFCCAECDRHHVLQVCDDPLCWLEQVTES